MNNSGGGECVTFSIVTVARPVIFMRVSERDVTSRDAIHVSHFKLMEI